MYRQNRTGSGMLARRGAHWPAVAPSGRTSLSGRSGSDERAADSPAANAPQFGEAAPEPRSWPLCVLVIDAQSLSCEGVSAVVRSLIPGAVVGQANSLKAGINLMGTASWNLIFVSTQLPDSGCPQALQCIRERCPGGAIVALCDDDLPVPDGHAQSLGVHAALGKIADIAEFKRMVLAFEQARLSGRQGAGCDDAALPADDAAMPWRLTQRQSQVLNLLNAGMSNKAIARALKIAEATVKIHVGGILRALNVTSRSQAIIAAANSRRN